MAMADLKGDFIQVNKAFCSMTGFSSEELIGKSFTLITHHEDINRDQGFTEKLHKGLIDSFHIEKRYIHKKGRVIWVSLYVSVMRNESHEPLYLIGQIEDITEKHTIKTQLEESENMYHQLIESSADAIMIFDLQSHKVIYINEQAELLLGKRRAEVIGHAIFQIHPADEAPKITALLTALIRQGKVEIPELNVTHQNGNHIPVNIKATVIKTGNKTLIQAIIRDQREQKRLEIELRENQSMLGEAEMIAQVGSYSRNLLSGEVKWSDNLYRIYGYEPFEIIPSYDLFIQHVIDEDVGNVEFAMKDAIAHQQPFDFYFKIITKKGAPRTLNSLGQITFDLSNKPIQIRGIIQDVTQNKDIEKQLERSRKEKVVLLTEIHHRVKNNLAIVTGLLKLQKSQHRDTPCAQLLDEAINRITAIALVHEKLYRANDFGLIDFSLYIQEIARELFQTFSIDPNQIGFHFTCGNIELGINTAVPCGLLINELMTNSLKYAFPASQNGTITLRINVEGGRIEIYYGDDGIGLPENVDLTQASSIGLNLINNIVTGQLQGQIDLDPRAGAGTHFNIQLYKTYEDPTPMPDG